MGTFQWDEWIVKTWVVRAHEEAQGPGGRGQEKQSVEPVLQSLLMHSGFKIAAVAQLSAYVFAT